MTLRVLCVEDSPTDCKLLLQELHKVDADVAFERVEDAAAMRAALAKPWDVVLCDWSLPRFSAHAALDVLNELALDIPFIIVTGTMGEEHAVSAMRAGAKDYVLKDKLDRLVPAIERELAERVGREARREAERRMRQVVESSLVGVWFCDPEGRTTFMNARVADILGVTPEEAIHRSVSDFVDEDARALFAARLSERAQGKSGNYELTLRRKDGSRRSAVIESAPIYDATGAMEGILAVVTDISGLKQTEAALRKTEEQLRQAQKMEAIGNLAGGVAHDFNNLLSVILSYSGLLASDFAPGDPRRADVLEIESAGRRAAELTQQLLAFGRRQILQPRVVVLNDVIAGLDRMLRRLIGEDIELSVVLGKDLGKVRVDPGQIEQIVMNLSVNSRDAMPEGGKLTIETANVVLDAAYESAHLGARSGPHVMLAVTDTGTGMDAKTQARMFEPFFTTKEQGKGTGLGLATVFGIVQQSGGNIWLYTELGKGTTFKIYFPQTSDGLAQTTLAPPPPTTLDGVETILLVEDDESVRVLARTVLRRHGYHVLDAPSGGDALLICEQHQAEIHLMVTDVVMPRMSGRQLAERVRALRPNMKVLYMSGYTANAIVHHGVLDSDVTFLSKPLTPDGLLTKVRAVLDG